MVFTNAYADGLVPALQRSVLPVGSFIIATEVLDPQVAEVVSPRRRMLVDTKNFLFYWRLTPDGRMAFGGRRSFARTSLTQAREFLGDQLVRVHPQLADVKVEYVWGGNVAITYDRLPHVGSIDGAWYATGCNGSGVATNTWMGARLAQALCGDAALPAFSELRHPRIPALASAESVPAPRRPVLPPPRQPLSPLPGPPLHCKLASYWTQCVQ